WSKCNLAWRKRCTGWAVTTRTLSKKQLAASTTIAAARHGCMAASITYCCAGRVGADDRPALISVILDLSGCRQCRCASHRGSAIALRLLPAFLTHTQKPQREFSRARFPAERRA